MYSGNQSMGRAEKIRRISGSVGMSSTTYTLKTTLVLWACGPYVAKLHPEYHAIHGRVHGKRPVGRQVSAGSIMSETTGKSWVSLWRKQIECGEGPGEVEE